MDNELLEDAYLQALLEDFRHDLPYMQSRFVQSIYIGGGTPTLFSPQTIEKLLNEIYKRLPFAEEIEITIEANPATFDLEKLLALRKAGINRISLGVQSFQDSFLKTLKRVHSAEQAKQAIEMIHQAEFYNFNLDLMHGLPGQSVENAIYDLQTAFSFCPPHLSWYELTIEPDTYFYTHKPLLPDEDTLIQIQKVGRKLLSEQGYRRYEVSAYCLPGQECKHNLNYWTFGDYLGIGAGAHGKITLSTPSFRQLFANELAHCNDNHGILRYAKIRRPEEYIGHLSRHHSIDQNFYKGKSIVTREFIPLEFMMNALRLTNGVPTDLFPERTGIHITNIQDALTLAHHENYIEDFSKTLKTTPKGGQFLNQCLSFFTP